MPTNGRERMGDISELLVLLGERLAEAAYRVRVEAIKAARLSRVRMEMVMLRRERRAAMFRLGEAAFEAVREGRVADPVLVARAREVEDVTQALDAKAEEAGRIADLPDDQVVERAKGKATAAAGTAAATAAGTAAATDEPSPEPAAQADAPPEDGARTSSPPIPPAGPAL